MPNMKRGEIYYASLEPVIGSEQGGNRPVLVIQNDGGQPVQPHDHRSGYHQPTG